MKLSKGNFILKLIAFLVVAIVTSIWASNYFSTKVFYLDNNKYSGKSTESTQITKYTSWFGEPIRITHYPDYKQLQINREKYQIKELESMEYNKKYQVTYPSGIIYTLEDVNDSGFLMAYDKNGELVFAVEAYSNIGRIMSGREM